MSLRDRRIVSAMSPEAEAKLARAETEGLDPITGKPLQCGVGCACEWKRGLKPDGKGKKSNGRAAGRAAGGDEGGQA